MEPPTWNLFIKLSVFNLKNIYGFIRFSINQVTIALHGLRFASNFVNQSNQLLALVLGLFFHKDQSIDLLKIPEGGCLKFY
jgi:hypothetical protein